MTSPRQMHSGDRAIYMRSNHLASWLNGLLESMISEVSPRSELINAIAKAADRDDGTINQILRGDIKCPPIEVLEGFAKVLDTSIEELRSRAESDGCKFDGDN